MARILREQDIREILYGATFLGAGGGGGLEDGLVMLEDNVRMRGKVEVTLVEAGELKDGANAAMIAGMGAPTVLSGMDEKFRYEAGYAFDAMRDLAFFSGRQIDAILPVEYGAVNCFVPMIACMERNVPLVDADGCGRAVPGLDVTMFDLQGIPFAPAVITSSKGDVITVYPRDAADGKTAENICRNLCAVYGYVMGLGGWITSKRDIQDKLINGSLSYAQKVGRALLTARERGGDVEAELGKVIQMRKLAQGRIVRQENTMVKGHDVGVTTLESGDGKKFFIDVKNESIVFRDEKTVLLTCPDRICAIDLDTCAPLTNADIREGSRVAYFAIPAPEPWFGSQKALAAWRPYFDAVGYQGEIVRF